MLSWQLQHFLYHEMDSIEVFSLLQQLDDDIDELEDSLAPILETALSTSSSKLPVLDKAKLYVLVTYAIESMLFSYLRLNGVKAREHPVFKELTRVRQYFGKIKDAERPSNEVPGASLDKQAATRFIRAGLSGNAEYDAKRARFQEGQSFQRHIKFEDLSKNGEKATSSPSIATDNSDSSSVDGEDATLVSSGTLNPSKKRKADLMDESMLGSSRPRGGLDSEPPSRKRKKNRPEKRNRKKMKDAGNVDKDKGALRN